MASSEVVVLSGAKNPRTSLEAAQRSAEQSTIRFLAALLFALALCGLPAHAQGCAQCLDSARATPPGVQAAYRHAIYLLGGAGTVIFIAAAVMLRRDP